MGRKTLYPNRNDSRTMNRTDTIGEAITEAVDDGVSPENAVSVVLGYAEVNNAE